MASDAALTAINENKCARARLGHLDLCAVFEKHGLSAAVAALCCGSFSCVRRDDAAHVGACDGCSKSEWYWMHVVRWWSLASEPVWYTDHHMLMTPESLSRTVLGSEDPDWMGWRVDPKKQGNLPAPYLMNFQPARVFLSEHKAGEHVLPHVCPPMGVG